MCGCSKARPKPSANRGDGAIALRRAATAFQFVADMKTGNVANGFPKGVFVIRKYCGAKARPEITPNPRAGAATRARESLQRWPALWSTTGGGPLKQ
jgi:hypothetical protein